MHSDQSSSITSVSASLSALRKVAITGAGCFLLSSTLIIATPFWQSDLLSAIAAVAFNITAAVAINSTERSIIVLHCLFREPSSASRRSGLPSWRLFGRAPSPLGSHFEELKLSPLNYLHRQPLCGT